jgi:hypothetical protein
MPISQLQRRNSFRYNQIHPLVKLCRLVSCNAVTLFLDERYTEISGCAD